MERKTQLMQRLSHLPGVLPQEKRCINDPLRNGDWLAAYKGFARCTNLLR